MNSGARSSVEAGHGAPVLVADNDRNVSDLLCAILARSGIRTGCAYDGNAAQEQGRSGTFRVVVCDLDMPGASGLDVIASFRDLAAPPLVVVISGYVDDEIQRQLAAWPFVRAVLRKPFDLHEFARIVGELLGPPAEATEKG